MLSVLESLPADALTRVYGDGASGGYVCGAVLRLLDRDCPLDAVAKAYVMRMCFLTTPLPVRIASGRPSHLECLQPCERDGA